jgi:hypothetical protein
MRRLHGVDTPGIRLALGHDLTIASNDTKEPAGSTDQALAGEQFDRHAILQQMLAIISTPRNANQISAAATRESVTVPLVCKAEAKDCRRKHQQQNHCEHHCVFS